MSNLASKLVILHHFSFVSISEVVWHRAHIFHVFIYLVNLYGQIELSYIILWSVNMPSLVAFLCVLIVSFFFVVIVASINLSVSLVLFITVRVIKLMNMGGLIIFVSTL